MRGIDAAGVYLPRYRLESDAISEAWGTNAAGGIRRKTVAGADEDVFTMAVAAAERVFDSESTAVRREDISLIAIGTTNPPLEEGSLAGAIARALGLEPSIKATTMSQTTAAGAEAMSRGLDHDGDALVVVSDAPTGEAADVDHALGAGSAAMIISDDATVPTVGESWCADDAPGVRYRRRGADRTESLSITQYDRRKTRSAIEKAVSSLDTNLDELTSAAIHQPDPRFPRRIARSLPIDDPTIDSGTVVDTVGDLGAATVPIGLLSALDSDIENERSKTLAAFFGGGEAAAFLFEGGIGVVGLDAVEDGLTLSYPEYLRRRGYITTGDVPGGGAHVSMPNWRNAYDQRYRLVAGRCPVCDALNFPPRGACTSCHERGEFRRVELPRTGTVRAVTVINQGGAPPEFAEQQQRDGAFAVAIVAISDPDTGEDVRMPGQLTDADLESVAVGDRVVAVIRRIYEQEGVPRYGVKFAPATEEW